MTSIETAESDPELYEPPCAEPGPGTEPYPGLHTLLLCIYIFQAQQV